MVVQRIGNCPNCGYWDPFHSSWYTPDKEVAEPKWMLEFDPIIYAILKAFSQGLTVEHFDGDWWYHLTRSGKTIERYPISILKVGLSPAEKVGITWRDK